MADLTSDVLGGKAANPFWLALAPRRATRPALRCAINARWTAIPVGTSDRAKGVIVGGAAQ